MNKKPRILKGTDHIYEPGDIILNRDTKRYYLVMETVVESESISDKPNRYWSYYMLKDLNIGTDEKFRFCEVNTNAWKRSK